MYFTAVKLILEENSTLMVTVLTHNGVYKYM